MDRLHPRISEPSSSKLTSRELSQRAIEYRRTALTAHGDAAIKSLNMLAARYAVLAARREIEEMSAGPAAVHQDQPEVKRLRALAEETAADEPDPVEVLANTIRIMAQSEADSHLVLGVLIEGAVLTLRTSIPAERHRDCASALIKMLIDRLQDNGITVSHGG